MTRKRTAIGLLLLVLAVEAGTVTGAQDDLPPPLVGSLDQMNLLKGQPLPAGAKGDQSISAACCSPCPTFYGYAEALFLERTNCSSDQPVIVRADDLVPVLSTSDFGFGYDPAVRVLLGHRLCNGWALEGSYLGLFDARASASAASLDQETNLTFPGGLGFSNVFGDINSVSTDYSSALHSGEVNLVCCCGCCTAGSPCATDCTSQSGCSGGCPRCQTFEWFVGLRYLNLAERFHIYGARDQTETGGDGTTGVESGVYDIRTSNNLIGPQVGARVRRWGARWGWEATGKAGVLGNAAHQEQYVMDYNNFPIRPLASADEGQVAFLGELGLTGIYRLNETWNLRAGYNLLYLAGVALAPDQLDFSGDIPSGGQLHSNGGVLLHGVSFGIEARW
jgi:hypothetical protein